MASVVRLATDLDVEQLASLFVASVDTTLPGVTFSSDPGYDLDLIRSTLQTRLFPPRSRKTYVLELHTGEIVGYGNVKPDGGPNNDEPELDMFFVKVGLGGRGYGGQLMDAIQRDWREGGLWVHVFKENERAIRFYEKWGFRGVDGMEKRMKLSLQKVPDAEAIALCLRWSNPSSS